LPTPDYKEHTRALAWGLNLDQPDVTTPEEIAEFRRVSAAQLGVQQAGLDFWLDTSPDVLKRYRLWADKLRIVEDDESPNKWSASGLSRMRCCRSASLAGSSAASARASYWAAASG
jgi:hypothetical protein